MDVLQIDVLRRNLEWASQAVNDRVARGEITDEDGKKLLQESAQKLLHAVKIEKINPVEAWQYGDVFRTAKDWELARVAYKIAIRYASKSKNEDRRINDTLRLAEAEANLGQVEKAIELARQTFLSRPQEKAPILLSVLYEIVPGGRGKGHDAEFAKLLEDAVLEHEQVIVNPDTEAGKAFLAARNFHLMRAWDMIVKLYRDAGLHEEADKARARGSENMATHPRV